MKIGIFTDTYKPDINGVAISIDIMEQALNKKGDEIFVVAPNKSLEYVPEPNKHVWRLPSVSFYGDKRYRIVTSFLIKKDLEALPLDIVHTHTPFSVGLMGLRLSRAKKIPAVHTYHTRYQEYGHYLGSFSQLIKKPAMWSIVYFINRHQAVIAPSEGIKKELINFGVKRPIVVIPTGVDPGHLEKLSKNKDPGEILKRYNVPPDAELIVFTSRIAKEKNIEFLFEAMKRVFQARPNATLLVIGDGNERNNLESEVVKMGLDKKIIFTGFLAHEDIFPIYRLAKAFIFASHTETQGVAVLEALALGVPVIALSATGIDDLLYGDIGGYLIKEEDIQDFSGKIINILENKELRARKSMEAIQRSAEFLVDKTAQAIQNLYLECINNFK